MQALSPKILRALEFASAAHDGQLRKSSEKTPYISHPAYVGMVLLAGGFPEDVIIAGILHDVVEDTPVTEAELKTEFGEHAASLVMDVTEDKNLPWAERKEAYNRRLSAAPVEAVAISAADLLANRSSMLLALWNGENPWLHFSGDPPEYARRVLAYDRARIGIIEEKLRHPLVFQLHEAEAEVIALTNKLFDG